jgi:hypothetical protein
MQNFGIVHKWLTRFFSRNFMEENLIQIKKTEFGAAVILIKTLVFNFYAAYGTIYTKSQVPTP